MQRKERKLWGVVLVNMQRVDGILVFPFVINNRVSPFTARPHDNCIKLYVKENVKKKSYYPSNYHSQSFCSVVLQRVNGHCSKHPKSVRGIMVNDQVTGTVVFFLSSCLNAINENIIYIYICTLYGGYNF